MAGSDYQPYRKMKRDVGRDNVIKNTNTLKEMGIEYEETGGINIVKIKRKNGLNDIFLSLQNADRFSPVTYLKYRIEGDSKWTKKRIDLLWDVINGNDENKKITYNKNKIYPILEESGYTLNENYEESTDGQSLKISTGNDFIYVDLTQKKQGYVYVNFGSKKTYTYSLEKFKEKLNKLY